MLTAVLVVMLAQAAAPGSSAPAADIAEISRLEKVWNESHVRGDSEALDRLWSEDFVVTVPGMRVFTKPDVIGVWRSGRMKFQRYDTSNIRILVYDNAAVVTGRVQRSREVGGRVADDDWNFTKTYVRRNGRWQVAAFHASTYTP
jgi:ketosteroid isomerase-like protein